MRVKFSEDLDNMVCSYRKVLQPAIAYRKFRLEKVSSAPPKCIKRSRRHAAKSQVCGVVSSLVLVTQCSFSERTSDALGIMDEFYISLIDLSYSNIVAVSLEDGVYIWNTASESAELLSKFDDSAFPTLVKWFREGRFLSNGLSDGSLKKECARTLFNEAYRIACAGWLKKTAAEILALQIDPLDKV